MLADHYYYLYKRGQHFYASAWNVDLKRWEVQEIPRHRYYKARLLQKLRGGRL